MLTEPGRIMEQPDPTFQSSTNLTAYLNGMQDLRCLSAGGVELLSPARKRWGKIRELFEPRRGDMEARWSHKKILG